MDRRAGGVLPLFQPASLGGGMRAVCAPLHRSDRERSAALQNHYTDTCLRFPVFVEKRVTNL